MHEHTHTPHHHEHDHTLEPYEHEGHSHEHHTHDAREMLHHDCDHTHPGECLSVCGCSHEHANSHAHDLFNPVPSHGEVGHHCTSTCETHQHEADSAADVLFDTQPKHGEAGHACHAECSANDADTTANELFKRSETTTGPRDSYESTQSEVVATEVSATRQAKEIFTRPKHIPAQVKQPLHAPQEQKETTRREIDVPTKVSPAVPQKPPSTPDVSPKPILRTITRDSERKEPIIFDAGPVALPTFVEFESKSEYGDSIHEAAEEALFDNETAEASPIEEDTTLRTEHIEQTAPPQLSQEHPHNKEPEVSHLEALSSDPLEDIHEVPTIGYKPEIDRDDSLQKLPQESIEAASFAELPNEFKDHISLDPTDHLMEVYDPTEANIGDTFLDIPIHSADNPFQPQILSDAYPEFAPLHFEGNAEANQVVEMLIDRQSGSATHITQEQIGDPKILPIEAHDSIQHLLALLQSSASHVDIRDISILVASQLGISPEQLRESLRLTEDYRPTSSSISAASNLLRHGAHRHASPQQSVSTYTRMYQRVLRAIKRRVHILWKRINYTLPLADIAKLY